VREVNKLPERVAGNNVQVADRQQRNSAG